MDKIMVGIVAIFVCFLFLAKGGSKVAGGVATGAQVVKAGVIVGQSYAGKDKQSAPSQTNSEQ